MCEKIFPYLCLLETDKYVPQWLWKRLDIVLSLQTLLVSTQQYIRHLWTIFYQIMPPKNEYARNLQEKVSPYGCSTCDKLFPYLYPLGNFQICTSIVMKKAGHSSIPSNQTGECTAIFLASLKFFLSDYALDAVWKDLTHFHFLTSFGMTMFLFWWRCEILSANNPSILRIVQDGERTTGALLLKLEWVNCVTISGEEGNFKQNLTHSGGASFSHFKPT